MRMHLGVVSKGQALVGGLWGALMARVLQGCVKSGRAKLIGRQAAGWKGTFLDEVICGNGYLNHKIDFLMLHLLLNYVLPKVGPSMW